MSVSRVGRATTARHAMIRAAIILAGILCGMMVWAMPVSSRSEELASLSNKPAKLGRILVIVGAAGEEKYVGEFSRSAEGWKGVATAQHLEITTVGLASDSAGTDRDMIRQAIEQSIQADLTSLWIVMIGHGTFDRGITKFNLRGPDLSVSELGAWLKPWRKRLILLCCSSASSAFLTELSGPDRIIVTATRSSNEQNFARFGGFLASAITDTAADLDHDDEVSLLEAFLAAASQTDKFYKEASRLATEHALLDDNGDKLGTGANFFRGLRPAKTPESGKSIDGGLASRVMLRPSTVGPRFTSQQLAQRETIEQAIDALRDRKATMTAAGTFSEDDYFAELERLLLQLAELYQSAESSSTSAEVHFPAKVDKDNAKNK